MKRLILLRHAKSSWDRADRADAARPLNKRGARIAPLVGHAMAGKGYRPDLVLCSTAKRAAQTATAVLDAFEPKPKYKELGELYMATPRDILATVTEQGGNTESILVIGHNPGLGDLAAWLINDGDAGEISRLKDKFPTAAFAVIDLPIEHWRELGDTAVNTWNGRLVRFITPREIDDDND